MSNADNVSVTSAYAVAYPPIAERQALLPPYDRHAHANLHTNEAAVRDNTVRVAEKQNPKSAPKVAPTKQKRRNVVESAAMAQNQPQTVFRARFEKRDGWWADHSAQPRHPSNASR
jgi:hypothetical protein